MRYMPNHIIQNVEFLLNFMLVCCIQTVCLYVITSMEPEEVDTSVFKFVLIYILVGLLAIMGSGCCAGKYQVRRAPERGRFQSLPLSFPTLFQLAIIGGAATCQLGNACLSCL